MEGATNMATAISTLNSTVSAGSLWGVFNDAIPYVATVVVVGFGFYLVRRMIKGVSKGKARI